MSQVCSICGKHPAAGRNVSHSHRVTNRIYRPNVQKLTIEVNGHAKKARICTKCLKAGKVKRA
ncbi:MAG: 50S ribosomal protein L28 [Coriobacteriia bacterium]|nr:50S ribosomal protein L28 [Coriobacteriia bacterium]